MAEEMNEAEHAGDASLCDVSKTKQERKDYCGSKFADDWEAYEDCQTVDSFCFMCCDMEFGELMFD